MTQPVRALLLAAGLGTRLRPITLQTPKCLVPIGGEPLLGRWLRQLDQAGCESVLINTHMLMAARDCGVKRFLYSSSACVYAAEKQTSADVVALKESDAYPAMPEDGYGWEKLFSERMCSFGQYDSSFCCIFVIKA